VTGQQTIGELGVPLARLRQIVTSVTLVNNTAKTIDTTVPTGKKWRLLNIKATNPDDADRNIQAKIWKEAAKTNYLAFLGLAGVSASLAETFHVPNHFMDATNMKYLNRKDFFLDEGNTIEVVWATGGASTGATDADGLIIEVLEIGVNAP